MVGSLPLKYVQFPFLSELTLTLQGELPLVWGTSDYAGPNTPVESEMSVYMQTAWATFAKNPISGLTNYGWPLYDPSKPTLVNLGDGNATTAVLTNHSIADVLC